MPPVRRLTAILAADVTGYSRLMGANEEGTHERVQAHLGELVNPKIEEHRGRIVKNTGDGFLAAFPSVIDAVRCAVVVQRGMGERNEDTPPEKRIEFRIGINLGDVIVEEHDIFGDGVNVAARLEGLAEPSGVCVSGTVRDHIGDRLPYAFEDMEALITDLRINAPHIKCSVVMPGQIGTSIRANTRKIHSGDRESDTIDAAGLTQARERFALLGRDVSQLSDDQLRNLVAELSGVFATRR
jgi:hypothetical protein